MPKIVYVALLPWYADYGCNMIIWAAASPEIFIPVKISGTVVCMPSPINLDQSHR